MLVGGTYFSRHRVAFLLGAVVVFCFPALGWYVASRGGWLSWPSGARPLGFSFGLAGGAIILFEMLLWFRKKWRGRRLGATRKWMAWHIWLGLLALPLAIVHSGFGLGGSLSAATMILFLAVMASGVWGLAMQQVIPQKLLDEIPAESIVTEEKRLMQQYLLDAEGLIEELHSTDAELMHSVGSAVSVSPVKAAYRYSQLEEFYKERIVPYILCGRRTRGPLAARARSLQLFAELRKDATPAVRNVVDRLEAICEIRRQLDAQAHLYFWLHNWLCVHVPLSWALTIILVAHAIVALKLW